MRRIEALARGALIVCGYVLFLLLLLFPMALELLYLKASIFGVLALSVVYSVLRSRRFRVDRAVALWVAAVAGIGLFFVIRGFALGAPGAFATAQVYVLWPLIYGVLVGAVSTKRRLVDLENLVAVAALITGVYGLCYIWALLGILPDGFAFNIFGPARQGAGLYQDGYLKVTFPTLNSLPFVVPFVAALVIGWDRARSGLTTRLLFTCALATSFSLALLSGRHALQLVTVFSIPLVLALSLCLPRSQRQFSFRELIIRVGPFVAALVLVATTLFAYHDVLVRASSGTLVNSSTRPTIQPQPNVAESSTSDREPAPPAVDDPRNDVPVAHEAIAAIERIGTSLDIAAPSQDIEASTRSEQIRVLLGAWMKDPILGAGHGAVVPGFVRDPEKPWSYEVYYAALLFQVGIVGIAAYALAFVWLAWTTIRMIRRGGWQANSGIAMLAGLVSFLLASSTNPYLPRFDGLWVLFFPLALANLSLIERRGIAPQRPVAQAVGFSSSALGRIRFRIAQFADESLSWLG